MSKIRIEELEVYYCVGVTDEERAQPQRLLLTVDMVFDFSVAAIGDRLTKTIDYFELSGRLLQYGQGRSWKLIEKVATDVAAIVMTEFRPQGVTIEVKKFAVPQAKYVSVSLTQKRQV